MPKKTTKTTSKSTVKKAKKTQSSKLRVIARFIPAILLFVTAFSIYSVPKNKTTHQDTSSVLGYATSMNISDLLSATNSQRAANGLASLNLNTQLSNAAQAKANDMVARNYWSHTTPDGKQPWTFITAAGYSYSKAGENLAYGFDTGTDVISGWMNSTPHRLNLLSTSFVDVGFGFLNSADYINTGEQTVVVALYAAPRVVVAAAPAPASTTTTTPKTASTVPKATTVAPTPVPAPVSTPTETTETTQTPAPSPTTSTQKPAITTANNPKSATQTVASLQVSRIQMLTGGNAHWSSAVLVFGLAGMGFLWIIGRGSQIRRKILASEHYLLSHLHVDLMIIGFLLVGVSLLQTVGTIR